MPEGAQALCDVSRAAWWTASSWTMEQLLVCWNVTGGYSYAQGEDLGHVFRRRPGHTRDTDTLKTTLWPF